MKRVRRLLLGLALADILVFGAWIGREEMARRWGKEVLLPVEGYDPRDLLSGHYVQFRLVAVREARQAEEPSAPATVFCLETQDERAHVARPRRPGDRCPVFIIGTRDRNGSLDFGVNRFYVDERRSNEVLGFSASSDTYLRARVDGSGRIHPVDLVVNGKSVGGRGQ